MSDWMMAVVTAVACFALCGACIFHLFKLAKRVRWSRSERKWITRHPNPVVFWTKFGVVSGTAFLALAMGLLLLLLHGRHPLQPQVGGRPFFENVEAPPGDGN